MPLPCPAQARLLPARMTEAEAAEELGISVGSLRGLRRRGEIGYVQILNRIYHTPGQVRAYFDAQMVEPCQQITQKSQDTSKVTGSNRSRGENRGSGTGYGMIDPAAKSAASRLARETFKRPTARS